MSCLLCNTNPCSCPAVAFASSNRAYLNIWAPSDKHIDPTFESTTGCISVSGKLDYGTLNLIEMYLQGKSFEENKQEYLDAILKLPWVQNDNLRAIQTFNRLRELFSIFKER